VTLKVDGTLMLPTYVRKLLHFKANWNLYIVRISPSIISFMQ